MEQIQKMEAEILDLKRSVAEVAKQATATKYIVIAGVILNVLFKLIVDCKNQSPPTIPPQSVGSNNAVQIGANPKPESKRTFLTVKDVAERESVSERTIITAISQGRIAPQPERDGRAWTIAADYRFLPIMAAVSEPNIENQ